MRLILDFTDLKTEFRDNTPTFIELHMLCEHAQSMIRAVGKGYFTFPDSRVNQVLTPSTTHEDVLQKHFNWYAGKDKAGTLSQADEMQFKLAMRRLEMKRVRPARGDL